MKKQRNVRKRILAGLLVASLVLGQWPTMLGEAATADITDEVTVTVVDESGDTIEGASIQGSVYLNETVHTVAVETDVNGTASILNATDFEDGMEVTATVSKEGYKDDTATLYETSINTADADITVILIEENVVPDISVTATEQDYTGEPVVAATVEGTITTGHPDSRDTVMYRLDSDSEEDWTSTMPTITNVGTYTLDVKVSRSGFDDYEVTVTAEIYAADIETIEVEAYSASYDGEEHSAATVTGAEVSDEIAYRLDSELDDAWVDVMPTITGVGDYTLEVRITREDTNYNETIIEVYPSIEKADQSGEFADGYVDGNSTQVSIESFDFSTIYDFSVTLEDISTSADELINEKEITYTIDNEDIASIANDGTIEVYGPGAVTITASREGNENYEDLELTHTLIITNAGDLVYFESSNINYIFGENNGAISEQSLEKINDDDNGTITYSLDKNDVGISIDKKSGEVTITDYAELEEAITDEVDNNQLGLTITVEATKTVGTATTTVGKRGGSETVEYDKYVSDDESYTITISFMELEGDLYTLEGTLGNIDEVETGWYTSDVTVTPSGTTYKITSELEEDGSGFAETATISEEGVIETYVFMQDTETGGITGRIPVEVQIDKTAPSTDDMSISYSENFWDKLLNVISFGFYNSEVTVTFKAKDETAGINHFDYAFTSSGSTSNSELESGTLEVKEVIGGYATATLTITANDVDQYSGSLSFSATDKAGNVSSTLADDDNVIIIDTISPEISATYSECIASYNNQNYYNGYIYVTLTVEEMNFYSEDVEITVYKDGNEIELSDTSVFEISKEWVASDEIDEYVYAFTIDSGDGYNDGVNDGIYVIEVKYTDKSGNEMDTYTSPTMVIDRTAPELSYEWNEENQEITVKVTEHNFRAEDISVSSFSITDVNGNVLNSDSTDLESALQSATWEQDGDTYSLVLSQSEVSAYELIDGIYNLTLDYEDISTNEAETLVVDSFIVDYTEPSIVEFTYSESLLDAVISAITFGYYQSEVTVTLTSYDDFSGVETFDWEYVMQSNASGVNLSSASGTLIAVQDSVDKSKYTASITLPEDEADQLRGSMSASATDTYGNENSVVTDSSHIIVVDNITPTSTVTYNTSDRTVGTTMYYNSDVNATFEINEANFYAKDVSLTYTKDGGSAQELEVTWVNQGDDVYIATYTIQALSDHSNDGDYVIYLSYTDRSTNEMINYVSDTITVDTTTPVINVSYANSNIVNQLEDSEGNLRDYYGDTQVATITVTEHNMDTSEVDFTILAKDVEDNILSDSSLYTISAWTAKGDVYTAIITYPGDANYTFDIAYTDLATNVAKDYVTDYFTVDTTAPTNLIVSYSMSVLDTVLSGITFGFYGAKTTITITAEDSISPINTFQYSYVNADGVSSVNAELLEQLISEAEMNYSNGNSVASATFTVPKAALDSNNQFNGSIEFVATDRAGNSESNEESKRVVVDNIAPTATVTYNDAVNVEDSVSYYDGSINCTITINEANFYSEDVNVQVTKDGTVISAPPSWSSSSTDVHVGTFTLDEDGDYIITINYTDKSNNQMATYTSEQLTIDTEILEPEITINGEDGNGMAYKNEVVPEIHFEDINFASYEITLSRTRYNEKDIDVTEEFIADFMSVGTTEGNGTFDTFDEIWDNDGIYTLSVSMMDKAGHEIESSIVFTVNRFGSVYVYNDYLNELIADGGAYVQSISGDLVITEYNADKLLSDSLSIEITKDGSPLSEVELESVAVMNDTVAVGSSGWYEYEYVISSSNFVEDGIYKITIASKDATGNMPENTNYEDQYILFRVDSTAPEITSVIGLEENIINAEKVEVSYSIFDSIGLASVEVYVNGTLYEEITEFTDATSYTGTLVVNESSSIQTVQLVAVDKAGNEVNTNSEEFTSAYSFNDNITVSTSFFVRWYANKLVFGTSIAGVVLVSAGLIYFLFFKKKKKDEESNVK